MIRGVDAKIFRRLESGFDSMGEPIVEWVPETVGNVLWSQGDGGGSGLADGARPLGTDDEIVVHLPKSYTASVSGCEIEVGGGRYRFEGDPAGYIPELTPGRWNRRVTARRVCG